jgi:indole-3-glycerol phosphate synthase
VPHRGNETLQLSYTPTAERLSAEKPRQDLATNNGPGSFKPQSLVQQKVEDRMATILDQIVAKKRQEIAEARSRVPDAELESRLRDAPPMRDFRAALEAPDGIQVIAEVKKASPSAGVIRIDFDPVAIARIYEQHGAACISVLTDEPFFQGHLSYLTAIRGAVARPLLRKDFILDRYQLLEARLAGADAVLLIAEILDGPEFPRLLRESRGLGLQALVELYDAENLERVLDSDARLVGVNNRNLRDFVTRLEHTLELASRVPADCCLVSESGICTRADVLRLQSAGVRAVLVGESLMRADDIGAKLDELRGVNRGRS